MRVKYVRFLEAVGTPGYAGANIKKAKLRSKQTETTTPRDELMEEIAVEGPWLVLRALRTVPGRRDPVLSERYTPISNCVDVELVDEPEPARTKKGPTP